MKRFRIIGRLGTILAALAGIVVALGASVAPAALAGGDPHGRAPRGWHKHPPLPGHAHAAVTGGMPGWQIALIVAGAALIAGALVVLIHRARAARRVTVSAA
jgi:heme/copper-type cytochrome/quinol oxidase subunit 1